MTVQPQLRETADEIDLFWRDISYDVGWEANAGGVIRCRRVLNRRGDLFNAVEGVNLRLLACDNRGKNAFELLRADRLVRHIEVRLPKAFGSERLYLSGRQLPQGGFAGTLCAVDPTLDDVFNGQITLLAHMSEARTREESYRQEADIMLRGLLILLGQATAVEKLDALAFLMMEAIRGASHLLLQMGRDGTLRKLGDPAGTAASDGLAEIFTKQISPVTHHRDGNADTGKLRALLGIKTGDVAVIFLPVASESIALLCGSRRADGFLPEDIDFASRFALILKQALILKDEQEKLVQSAKLSALGQMSASLAHELRQPLNTISIAAQNLELMAESGNIISEALQQKATRILGQVERASQIMDRIRRFSRKSGGVFTPTDLVQLVEGVRVMVEPALTPVSAHLDIDVEPGLNVRCDAIQVEQLLVNLVCNALDVLGGVGTAHATEKGRIAIQGRKVDTGIVLRVSDNGPGFPADVTSRPLETFFTTKSAEKGTGLGLSICHMIAREHAGKLLLGNHGAGAYVELHLPDRAS